MTREDIIRMAHEAGDLFVTQFGVASATPEWLERFFRAAYAAGAAAKDVEHQQTLALQQRSYEREIQLEVEAEREECAQIADAEASIEGIAQRIAVNIRARGNT